MSSPAITLLISIKIILISTGAISIAMAVRCSVPSILTFTCYNLPVVWNALLTWLKPPYLYFIVNGIIITIAASSRFNQDHHKDSTNSEPRLISARTPPQSDVVAAVVSAEREPEELDTNVAEAYSALPPAEAAPVLDVYEVEDDEEEGEVNVVELMPVVVNGVECHEADDDEERVISETKFTEPQRIASPEEAQRDFLLLAKEKPLLSAKFGHRQPIKPSPDEGVGRAMGLAEPKKHDTLENTWKMITEGRHVQLTRHFKKSDTWENHGREVRVNSLDHDLAPQDVLRSETFRDRTNYDVLNRLSPIQGKIQKEPSLSQDELNRRVEAFIQKFNQEMRLQRQESLNKYMEMINRGA